MAFHGLFIGIDRYASPAISELGCANRDATALHALFIDTLGGDAKLLTDQDATVAAIEREFNTLVNTCEDDVVAIGFSGHGTKTHQLVAHDTDPKNLGASSITLDTLADWFSRIPSRRLILFLDCCFSGGIGSKVLQVDATPRDMLSTDALLDQLSGQGRLILTASGPNEPAYEKVRIGHGLLTHFLLEALQGAEEVQRAGKISVYRLLEYVTSRVIDAAGQFGESQRPTLRGSIDGELTWPIFKPGPTYHAAFPERAKPKVTEDIQSLSEHGFPQAVLEAWAGAIPTLNQLQLDAINEFNILDGEHLVVSAPTSSGKTMIGELAAIKGVLSRKKALFLLPLKALVYDKQRHFSNVYGPFGIRIIEATGETDNIAALLRGNYDICLLTYEKFAAVALGNPHVLDQVSTIVVDEVQMIADPSRGANLEFILTLLRMRRRQGIEPQLIALSAVIGDTNGLERWLDARLLRRDERPVPLDEGLLRADGSFRFIRSDTGEESIEQEHIRPEYRKGSAQDYVIPLVRKLVQEGKQVIVFRETKSETRSVARYLARNVGLLPAQDALDALPAGDPSRASGDLRETLRSGVAFHNADLDREERWVVEEHFRQPDANVRVIVATTTLAMGVNTPAAAVVIVGLTHPGDEPYSVAEYKNLAGRAGRLGFAETGSSYLMALDGRAEYEFWDRYVRGQPEDLRSRFLDPRTDARTLILRVLVSARKLAPDGVNAEDILDFLEGSFGAFQQRLSSEQWAWDRDAVSSALADLVEHGLIKKDDDGRLHITELGELVGEGGSEVISVMRLVDCLQSIEPDEINDPTLITATQITAELDEVFLPINKKSTQKEPSEWPSELRAQGVPSHVLAMLRQSASDQFQPTVRAKKAVACLLYVSGRQMAEIEGILTQFGGAFGGVAGPVRAVSGRTCDLLPTAIRVAEILNPGLDLSRRQIRLLTRLEIGLPGEAVDLALNAGRALARGDYLSLQAAGLLDISAIEQSDDAALLDCVQGDRSKLAAVRGGAAAFREMENQPPVTPILEPYQA